MCVANRSQNIRFSFCGEPILAGKPYCSAHCDEAFTTSRVADTTVIYRKDYQAPSHQVGSLELDIQIFEDRADITATMQLSANDGADEIVLDGEHLTLHSVVVGSQSHLLSTNMQMVN